MSAGAFVMPILSGLAGYFGGGKQGWTQSTGTSNQTTNATGTSSNTTTPNLSPLQQALSGLFSQGATDLYHQSTNLQPYTTQGLGNIQGQGTANANALRGAIASRGLSFSPAGSTAETMNQLNTGNQMQNFTQQIPLLQRQLQTQSLQQLMQAFGVLPTGVSTTGTTTQSGTSSGSTTGSETQYGNKLAGLFGGLAGGLGAPQAGSNTNLGGILSLLGLG